MQQMLCRRQEAVEDVPCGNTVAMVGLDQFITKNATLTSEKADDAHPIKAMKFSVSPVVSGWQSRVVRVSKWGDSAGWPST